MQFSNCGLWYLTELFEKLYTQNLHTNVYSSFNSS